MSDATIVDGVENQNVASDNAHVEQQIGVQNVGSVFHDTTIYHVTDGDSPERKHEVALAFLAGGLPRRAEKLLHDLIIDGHQTTERIYYHLLAVFSERGFGDLDPDLIRSIREAKKLIVSLSADEWSEAHAVAWSLINLARAGSGDGSCAAVAEFGELSAEKQDEISRHLSLVVIGVLEQRLDAERKHKVDIERFSRDRVARAWKFFEPDPAMPTRYRIRTSTTDTAGRRPSFIGGTVAALAFAGLFFGPMRPFVWGGLLLLLAGVAVMFRYGIEHTGNVLRIASRHDAERPTDEPDGFTQIDKLIERCFREACPPYAQDWMEYAAGYRRLLRRRFNDQLRYDLDYQQTVKKLKWLIDWHASRIAAKWPHHDSGLRSDPAPVRDARKLRLGGVLVALSGLVLLGIAHRWQVVPTALGGWFALPGVIEVFAARRASRLLLADADALLEEEMAEYHRRVEELADRPDDREMARWLALDKAHLKTEALCRGNIDERELVAHVVLNERAPYARRGVVPHGPPRYEAYLVRVILLTRHGVRSSRVYLDFATGEVKNENWDVFGYDRIASASLKEREKPVKAGSDGKERKVCNREFRLRLLDGIEIFSVSERLDVESDTDVEDEMELHELTAATSGMDAALPLLEAVARQGPAWIDYEYDRRNLWADGWSE